MQNGGVKDHSESEGHIELRIENFAGFAQEQEGSRRLSEPVYVRGVPWKILAIIRKYPDLEGQIQKYLDYFLQCNNETTEPLWSCSATAEMKILAQREGSVDHVSKRYHIFGLNFSPDFTKETAEVGCIPTDIKLRVDDHVFHVNKLLLSFCSDYFERMFNGGFNEANQEVVELKHEEANDPALFHYFLLILFIPEVLPGSKTMADILKLAQHYQAEEVTEKCMRHLRMCREMPVERRVLLTGEYGDEESQASILKSLSNEEARHINAVLLKKMFTLYAPK